MTPEALRRTCDCGRQWFRERLRDAVPLIKVNPFTDEQIALLGTFADQAVMAIESQAAPMAERGKPKKPRTSPIKLSPHHKVTQEKGL